MPKSKKSAKRRAKLRKEHKKTLNWAIRKYHNYVDNQNNSNSKIDTTTETEIIDAETIARFQEKMNEIEESNEDQRLAERIEQRIDERFEEVEESSSLD